MNTLDEKLIEIIRSEGARMDLERIRLKLTSDISKRTLQRQLAKLSQSGKIRALGAGPSVEYIFVSSEDDFIASKEGEEIKQLVNRSLQFRLPVSYNSNFLKSYAPNSNGYLSEKVLSHLSKIGTPPASSKVRPAGTYARQILDRLLIDLSWSSSRLEGNTYSLLETEELLKLGRAAEGKDALEAQMILNHKIAIEFLVESANEIQFNRQTILNLHAILSDGLLHAKATGRLRDIPVAINGSVYYPLEIPQKIEEHFGSILKKTAAIKSPYEQSFFIMVHLPYLQPFEDVNKRVSRLAANIPFIKNNLSPLSFIDVPEREYVEALLGVYELNKIRLLQDLFVWAYERSALRYRAIRSSLAEPDPFRMKHLELLREAVAGVVRANLSSKASKGFVGKFSKTNIDKEDQSKFVELVLEELSDLHEGNFARFQIRPSEFKAWKGIKA